MEESQVIIAYRSKSDQYADEFFHDVIVMWIYNNWPYIVAILGLLVAARLIYVYFQEARYEENVYRKLREIGRK